MTRFCALVVILLPLAVIAALAGVNTPVGFDPAGQGVSAFSPEVGSGDVPRATLVPALNASLLLAKGIDLGEVDRDKTKAGMNGNGDEEEGEEEENGDEKDGQDDKAEEGEGGGWDRTWDAPKLG